MRDVARCCEGEFSTVGPTYNPQIVSSNKPITVAQYALTQYCSDERNQMISDHQPIPGDPDMVILNPLEYSIDAITLYAVPDTGPHGFHAIGRWVSYTAR